MKVNLKYFGMVAEVAGVTEELMEVSNDINSEAISELLEEKYSKLNEIDYRLAINECLNNEKVTLNDQDIVAVLPPFSGG